MPVRRPARDAVHEGVVKAYLEEDSFPDDAFEGWHSDIRIEGPKGLGIIPVVRHEDENVGFFP
jgi:hypothetical protein